MDNSRDLLLIETMVKVAALQRVLVKKGLITDTEIHDEMTLISKDLVDQVKTISSAQSLEDFLSSGKN
jgi:hypothetical protein